MLFLSLIGNQFKLKFKVKKTIVYVLPLAFLTLGCQQKSKNQEDKKERLKINATELTFNSSHKDLVKAFEWARKKALSFAHDGSDPVGYWYEAALPNREAFCMRDVSHQAIGAEILGLSKHNYNMFQKFAQNISEDKDYCSYWEINRHDLPAPVDYENDNDFWYNLPANFDVIYNANRLYNWTGNRAYLEDEKLRNFYDLSMNEYVDHWDLGHTKVQNRQRDLHVKNDSSRFGNKRGIPTYNEGGRGETALGIDMTASLIAAYKAYAQISRLNGDVTKYKLYTDKAEAEQNFLNDFWWDPERNTFRSILYEDGSFDYFMVGDNQAFLHYLLYFDALSDVEKVKAIAEEYAENFDKLIVELKSYLPIIFYEHGRTALANQMVIDLCAQENERRDYPENSFTIIEHLTRGLMGIDVDAGSATFSTLPQLENQEDWAEMKNIPILSNKVSVKHQGSSTSIAANLEGPVLKWTAQLFGDHEFLYVNGSKTKSQQIKSNGKLISYCEVHLNEFEEIVVSTAP